MTSALVVVDPLNDFVSRRGKGWPMLRYMANDVGLIPNMRAAITAARDRGMPVVYAPHRGGGERRTYRYPTPNQDVIRLIRFFDGFGGRFHPELAPAAGDFVASLHEVSSGFGGTDLDAHLRSVGIEEIVICGLLTNTCVESTARHGVDLGYHVTVLTDAVAAWTPADHDASVNGSLRHVVHKLMTTTEFVS
ncbi:cysteine hydrolase family protein [Smaragdicoccus niigatensis]|uniref:cysteine hydrolase family protein n=1 Tax=Smaragdicoccus niigatensis TaxID=359359 RepID=UPI000373072B|nr:isochorismatase family cysteine hydrolase [Smaragdicoccus niigatensis]